MTEAEFKAHPDRVGLCLQSWRLLTDHLSWLSAEEVARALSLEEANQRRSQVLKRLRQRLGKLNAQALAARPL